MARKPKPPLQVETFTHDEASRTNIPTAEFQAMMSANDLDPRTVRYGRNHDLDPQLMWRGKDERDWSDLVVNVPPLFIQEKVHPKVLIDDLLRRSKERKDAAAEDAMPDLFADFNGIAPDAVTEFYQHDQNWTNRMILGDSLQVMASLAEREGLRGKVQCIYVDPPYGIKFNSNFQWSTRTNSVEDGRSDQITREPEQVHAFRDTWKDGIHSYLTYLRDRFTVSRELLSEAGSIFVQIGDENVHRVRSLLDEIFGPDNAGPIILVKKKGAQKGSRIEEINDYIILFYKDKKKAKTRQIFDSFQDESEIANTFRYTRDNSGHDLSISEISKKDDVGNLYRVKPLEIEKRHPERKLFTSENVTSGGFRKNQSKIFSYSGRNFDPGLSRNSCWKHTAIDKENEASGMRRLAYASRLYIGKNQLRYVRYHSDFGLQPISNWWNGFGGAPDQAYVVQTNERVVERCLLMATDPGDIVIDPTCGSGTTATVAEQWGRRWITIDTSRVAMALARARIMGARYPYYLLADSREGQQKEAQIARIPISKDPVRGDIRHGFVWDRRPHITSAVIANNAEIDVIWEKYQEKLEPLRDGLNKSLNQSWEEWEIPREAGTDWPTKATEAHAAWWQARIARQKKIDASIAARADQEYLYDRPYEDKSRARVAGPFTVESLSPHRVISINADDELIGLGEPGYRGAPLAGAPLADGARSPASENTVDFAQMIIENLKAAGVQQQKKDDRIMFSSVTGWPGTLIAAEGRYQETGSGDAATGSETGETETTARERRAAIFIGPEYGTVARADLIRAAREAAEADFDILVCCAFNYDAQSAEVEKLGRIQILQARMNPDLHMAGDLKASKGGNLFVVFGEPDITMLTDDDGRIRVKIHGVDVFRPGTGEIDSGGTDDIAMWFIDTSYNDESFFVRHAYFLGANDPYKSLKTTLKAEIDEEAWSSLYSDVSRPFDKPATGRIAVKVINHLGDEVMKVLGV